MYMGKSREIPKWHLTECVDYSRSIPNKTLWNTVACDGEISRYCEIPLCIKENVLAGLCQNKMWAISSILKRKTKI